MLGILVLVAVAVGILGSSCIPQDRIDQTTLNAALFFTVKPSELRLLSVLGSGGYANVYKAVPQFRVVFFGPTLVFSIGGKARQMAGR